MAVEVGSAYISLQASTKQLDKTIKDSLDGSVRHADNAGRQMGDKLSSHIKTGLNKSVTHASTTGDTMGKKMLSSLLPHFERGGKQSGDSFGKGFGPKMAGIARSAMSNFGNTMIGVAEGIGSQAGGKLSGALTGAITAGAGRASSALASLGSGAGGALAGVSAAGAAAATGVGAITVAAVVATQKLFELGEKYDNMMDAMLVKANIAGQQAQQAMRTAGEISKSTAAPLESIGSIQTTLMQVLKRDSTELAGLTKQIADYNEMTGESLDVRGFAMAMKKQGVTSVQEMSDALNVMYNLSKNTGTSMSTWIASVKGSKNLGKELKIPWQDILTIQGEIAARGGNPEQIMLGLRMAARSIMGDKNVKDVPGRLREIVNQIQTFKAQSEDLEAQAAQAAGAGDTAKAEDLLAQAAAISKMEDELGSKTFKRPWIELKSAIEQIDLENLNGQLAQTGSTIEQDREATADYGEQWTIFKNNLEQLVAPAANKVFEGLNALISGATVNVKLFTEGIGSWFAKIKEMATGAAEWVKNLGDKIANSPIGRLLGLDGGDSFGSVGAPGVPAVIGEGATAVSPPPGMPDAGGNPLRLPGVGGGGRGWMNYSRTAQALDALSTPAGRSVISAQIRAQGQPYDYGGSGAGTGQFGGYDCSGIASAIYSDATGRNVRFTTDPNQLIALGFKPGFMPGALNIGMTPGAGMNGHMALTLPNGMNVESGGSHNTTLYGGAAAGAMNFPTQWYFPLSNVPSFDTGGWLPPGYSIVKNETGQDELILNPEQQKLLQEQGIDPNTLLHGQANGAPPGPVAAALGDTLGRTEGFSPAAAATGGVAGTSFVAGLLSMGNDWIGGLIDTGVSLAQQAAQVGMAGATMGGSTAAGPLAGAAASYGIQLIGAQAKRVSSYLFQMASIGVDSLIAQLFPFGAPRWMGYDYTQFIPKVNIGQAGVTTVEKASQAAQAQAAGQPFDPAKAPGGPVNPQFLPGMQGTSAPVPQFGSTSAAPITAGPADPAAAAPVPEPPPPPPAAVGPAPAAPGDGMEPWLKNLFGFDNGGWLEPGQLGINMTGRPEPVLTPKQWDSLALDSPQPSGPLVKIDTIYGMDPTDVASQIEQKQRLAVMRYGGRPFR